MEMRDLLVTPFIVISTMASSASLSLIVVLWDASSDQMNGVLGLVLLDVSVMTETIQKKGKMTYM
jgi:hypothetical protein